MSHFYGKVMGSRGEATRCGDATSGLEATAAGWQGAVTVKVWQNPAGEDYFIVSLHPWKGSGGKTVTLSMGRLNSDDTAQPSVQSMTRMINTVVDQAEALRH
jgi:hypothetical protein